MGINLGGNFGMSNNDSMSVLNLQKNDILDLTKKNPGLKKVILGAGWDISRNGADFDLDIAAFLLDSNNKFNTVSNVIFFNNPNGQGVTLSGDNRTGAGDGDDEQVQIELNSIPAEYNRLVFVVNIYDAKGRNQHFGMIQNAFIRIVNGSSNQELLASCLILAP